MVYGSIKLFSPSFWPRDSVPFGSGNGVDPQKAMPIGKIMSHWMQGYAGYAIFRPTHFSSFSSDL